MDNALLLLDSIEFDFVSFAIIAFIYCRMSIGHYLCGYDINDSAMDIYYLCLSCHSHRTSISLSPDAHRAWNF